MPVATTLALAAVAVTAVAVPVLGLHAVDVLANSTTGQVVAGPGVASLPFTPTALLATVDDTGEVTGITVLALSPSGAGGTAVVVPVGATIQAADGSRTRVADAYREGGLPALTAAVENLTGIAISTALDVDEQGLAELLAPHGPFEVDLPDAVVGSAADGAPVILYEPGPQTLDAEQVAEVLTTRRPSETELVRLPAIEATWRGIVAAGEDTTTATPPTTAPAALDGFLAALLAGPAQERSLTARPLLDPVSNPSGSDMLSVDPIETALLMARIAPSAVSPASAGLRVRVVDATGDPRAAYELVQRLAFVGMSVVMLEDAPAQAATVVEVGSDVTRDSLGDLQGLFGPYRIETAIRPIDGVDMTVIVGSDFLDAVGDDALDDGPATTVDATPTTPATPTAPATGAAPAAGAAPTTTGGGEA